MPVSPAEREYVLSQIGRFAETDLNNLWRQAEQLGTEEFFAYVRDGFVEVANGYHQTTGQLAATWFEESDLGSSFVARVAEPITPERLLNSVNWALGGDGVQGLARMQGSMQRAVYDGARDTVVLNAEATKSRWIRVARANACEFCRMLATRSGDYAYLTRESAVTVTGTLARNRRKGARKMGSKFHDDCYCTAVEVRDNQSVEDVLTEDKLRLYEQWNDEYDKAVANAGTRDTKKVLSAWREQNSSIILVSDAEAAVNRRRELLAQLREADDLSTIKSIAEQLQPNVEFVLNPKATIGREQSDVAMGNRTIDHVKSTVRAVDDVLTKYPDMKVKQIKFDKGDGLEYAYARLNSLDQSNGAELINMNSAWMTNPQFNKSFRDSVNEGFHYQGKPWYREGDDTAAYAVATHELGHVMNWNTKAPGPVGQNGADWVVNDALRDYFVKTYDVDVGKVDDLNAYKYWLRHNLSGYSFIGADVNKREALAEAFVDVEINGDRAYETSKVLHHLLVQYHKGTVFSEDFQWPDFRPNSSSLNRPMRPKMFEIWDKKILDRAKQLSLRGDDA